MRGTKRSNYFHAARATAPPRAPLRRSGVTGGPRFALDVSLRRPQNHRFVATTPKHDAPAIHQAVERIAAAIAGRHATTPRLLLLGIADGGIVFAHRLAAGLRAAGLQPSVGTVDISFHRDDIGRHPIPKEYSPTFIPQEVNGAAIILADDVLHTGRTVKAALDELFDHGRPAGVELAVLVDRGGHRLPIAATYCGLTVTATDDEKIVVRLDAADPAKDTIRLGPARRRTAPPFHPVL